MTQDTNNRETINRDGESDNPSYLDKIYITTSLIGFFVGTALAFICPYPIVPSLFFGAGFGSFVFRFGGGLEQGEWTLNSIKITGYMASWLGTAFLINYFLDSQRDLSTHPVPASEWIIVHKEDKKVLDGKVQVGKSIKIPGVETEVALGPNLIIKKPNNNLLKDHQLEIEYENEEGIYLKKTEKKDGEDGEMASTFYWGKVSDKTLNQKNIFNIDKDTEDLMEGFSKLLKNEEGDVVNINHKTLKEIRQKCAILQGPCETGEFLADLSVGSDIKKGKALVCPQSKLLDKKVQIYRQQGEDNLLTEVTPNNTHPNDRCNKRDESWIKINTDQALEELTTDNIVPNMFIRNVRLKVIK